MDTVNTFDLGKGFNTGLFINFQHLSDLFSFFS
jgi:hypothetical protein